jgi:hypothetical protein
LLIDVEMGAEALLTLARQLDPSAEVATLEGGRLRVSLPVGSPARDSLLGELFRAGYAVRSLAEEPAGLEEIFLAATRRDAGAKEARTS